MNPAAEPQPVEDVQGDGRWMSMHHRFLAEAKEKEPEVVFIGDSLISNLVHCQLWEQMFEPLHCLNFGIGGDQTQHVLWRIREGELDAMDPKVVVVLVGTNNHGHTAEQVTEGVVAIADLARERQPEAHIIIMGLPPRGQFPNPLREKIAEINAGLAKALADRRALTFLPSDPALFVAARDGSISHRDMWDYLHLTAEGYAKLCEPLLDTIQPLLQNFIKVENTSMDKD